MPAGGGIDLPMEVHQGLVGSRQIDLLHPRRLRNSLILRRLSCMAEKSTGEEAFWLVV